jgi:hypothetical protein
MHGVDCHFRKAANGCAGEACNPLPGDENYHTVNGEPSDTGSGNSDRVAILSAPVQTGLTGDDMEGQSIEKACNGNRCDVADDIAGASVGCDG